MLFSLRLSINLDDRHLHIGWRWDILYVLGNDIGLIWISIFGELKLDGVGKIVSNLFPMLLCGTAN
jgi:hypothetical protein